MRTIAVRLPKELIECIDIYSLVSGKNRSEIIREALNHYINPNNKNKYKRPKPRKICSY
ncbi:MAG: ribbon-helix-helix domain-containing protein [Desulfurococcaceae archaeon TW002]